jgi:hypothetical protein
MNFPLQEASMCLWSGSRSITNVSHISLFSSSVSDNESVNANLQDEGNTRVRARNDGEADDKYADVCWVEEFSIFSLSTYSANSTP